MGKELTWILQRKGNASQDYWRDLLKGSRTCWPTRIRLAYSTYDFQKALKHTPH